MIDLKRVALVLSATAMVPGIALANTGECPDMSEVLALIKPEGTGDTIDQVQLAEEVGEASSSATATRALSDELNNHLPGNGEAEIADLMIASYCQHLMTSETGINLDSSVQDYQNFLYKDVFGDPSSIVTPTKKRPEGWLFGN